MKKRRNATRLLSFLLAFLLILGDNSLQYVMATGTVSGSDVVADVVLPEEATDNLLEETDSLPEETFTEAVSDGDALLTVSDGNIPLREPEEFYTEAAPENYGVLVDYDEYSRTYHVDGDSYVTVIGNDSNTYINEAGELVKVDNTLIENPMTTFGRIGVGTSYVNTANDYMVQLNSDVTVSGGDLLSVTDGEHVLTLAPTEGNLRDGMVKDNAIRYNNVFEDIDYQYTLLGNSVKEDIILLQPVEKTALPTA